MPRHCRDLTGRTYGKLTVLARVSTVEYGGRLQALWLCRCECGQEIELPADKLPVTELQQKTLMKSGRRLYDSCERCRSKTCPVCGEKFSFSHPSFICPSNACQTVLTRERMRYWQAVEAMLYRIDPQFRADVRQYQNAYYADHRKKYIPISQCPPEEQTRRREASRTAYQRMRMDPERWAHWLELQRAYKRLQKIKGIASPDAFNAALESEEPFPLTGDKIND